MQPLVIDAKNSTATFAIRLYLALNTIKERLSATTSQILGQTFEIGIPRYGEKESAEQWSID